MRFKVQDSVRVSHPIDKREVHMKGRQNCTVHLLTVKEIYCILSIIIHKDKTKIA